MSNNNELSGVELALAIAAAALAVWGWRNRGQIVGTLAEALKLAEQSKEDQSEVIHDALPAPLLLTAHAGEKGKNDER